MIMTWDPKPTDLTLELPEKMIETAITQFRMNKGTWLSKEDVKDFWTVFKSLHFDGINWYPSQSKAFKHFIEWIKYQNINVKPNQAPGDFRIQIAEQYQKFLIGSASEHSWPAEAFYSQLVKDGYIKELDSKEISQGEKRALILEVFQLYKCNGRKSIY